MNRTHVNLDPDELQGHTGFLKRLARSLVHDEHDSEDLVQQAWATAFAVPPRDKGRLRSWLASIVRNRASNMMRDRARRQEREHAVARPEGQRPEDEIDAELDLQESVLSAFRSLNEPYKTAMYLRYFRDLSLKEIAQVLDVPVSTVDTRLVRGRATLRSSLTREFGGDRRNWLLLMLPLSGSSRIPGAGVTAAAQTMGAWIVAMKLKIALTAAASVLVVSAWLWPTGDEALQPGGIGPQSAAEVVLAAPQEAALEQVTPRVHREEALEPAPSAEAEARVVQPSGSFSLHGRILDHQGQALAFSRVRFEPGDETPRPQEPLTALSDGTGLFTIEGVPGSGEIVAAEPELVTVLAGSSQGVGYESETIVVAAPVRSLSVQVVDEAGKALGGAQVRVNLPSGFRDRFAQNLESSSDLNFNARAPGDGSVELSRVPAITGCTVSAQLDGYELRERDLDSPVAGRAADPLILVLARIGRDTSSIQGLVIDEYGDPVPQARVAYGVFSTRTDDEGRFLIDTSEGKAYGDWSPEEARTHALMAVRPGYLPAILQPELDSVTGEPIWIDPIVLQAVLNPLSISGRVEDENGDPLSGYMIFLPEAHLFSSRTTVEGAIHGGSEFVHQTTTDARGRFELGGLLNEPYDVTALDKSTLLMGSLESVEAGTTDARIVVDTTRVWSEVSGRVVSRSGEPLEGVVVTPYVLTQTARGANGVWTAMESLESKATKEDGSFSFDNIPRQHVELRASHPDIMYLDDFKLPPNDIVVDPKSNVLRDVEIIVSLRLRFQVLLDDPEAADEIRVLNAEGGEMNLYMQTAKSYLISNDYRQLNEGLSRHLFVEEGARTLLLLEDGVEVRRVELDLNPREETQLHL